MTSHSWRNTPDCNVCDRNVPGSLAAIVTYRHMDTLYSYIHTYMHTHIYILMMMHINTSIYIRTNINKQTAAHIHTYIHTYIYICMHKYIIYTRPCSTSSIQPNLTSSCQCIHIYIYTCLCIYIYAYAQLHNIVCYVCCI